MISIQLIGARIQLYVQFDPDVETQQDVQSYILLLHYSALRYIIHMEETFIQHYEQLRHSLKAFLMPQKWFSGWTGI